MEIMFDVWLPVFVGAAVVVMGLFLFSEHK